MEEGPVSSRNRYTRASFSLMPVSRRSERVAMVIKRSIALS